MLASFAFLSTGLVVILFALTIKRVQSLRRTFPGYWLAYVMLSLAFFGYGIGTLSNTPSLIEYSVLAGNFLIILGSILLIIRDSKKFVQFALGGVALAGLGTAARALWFYPVPELKNGILLFNTQPPAAIFLALLFLGLWLPVNLRVAKTIAISIKLPDAYLIYSGLFALATAAAVFFLAARSTASVVVSFAALAGSFLALLCINLLTRRMES